MRTFLPLLVLAGLLASAPLADAAPVSTCNAAKKRCIGKYVAAALGCHAKAKKKGLAVAAACLDKARAKVAGDKGCFAKRDGKAGNDCSQPGNASQQLADADALLAAVLAAIDPDFAAPSVGRCTAARAKCAGKLAAGMLGCSAKSNEDGVGDPACAETVAEKFAGAKGCDPKALAKGPDCTAGATSVDLGLALDAWQALAAFMIDYSGPACGNGVLDPGEACDPGSPERPETVCGADFACVDCNCACPTTLHLRPDAASPETRLDLGWVGHAHGMPLPAGADLTLAVTDCDETTRPCGTCTLSGPVANAGGTAHRNRRCTNDSSIQCASDAPCTPGGGTCEWFFGPPLPLSTAGVSLCVTNSIAGPVSGTVDVESGAAALTMQLTAHVYTGVDIDAPCPPCVGDAEANDDVALGTCADGERAGLACDANATVPGRPDFGAVSLDCPPFAPALVGTWPIAFDQATDPVTKSITAASPSCSHPGAGICLCDTCNNANAEPCSTNADCPDPAGPIGPICGGRRCVGGVNEGAACSANSQCPGGGFCSRLGVPTQPTACFDAACVDTSPVDGRGECVNGPMVSTCSEPHAQRTCTSHAECTPGVCQIASFSCFADATSGVTALGAADAPARDVASPTLASVFCVAPTFSASANTIIGLPGPGRSTLRATTTVHP